MPIHTVLGTIDPDRLGPTSMHEHLFLDAADALEDPETETIDQPVTIDQLGDLHWNAVSNRANLALDDADLLTAELQRVREHGGGAIVDVTPFGMGRRVADLPIISEHSGVHILMGCGFYRHPSHPPWVAQQSAEQLAEYLVGELENGLDGTGIKPALIGEIGTADPVSDDEWKVLHASAIAAELTGVALSIHVDPQGGYQTPLILEWLTGHGADPTRVIMGHSDEVLNLDNHRDLMNTGATVEYDLFGTEFYYPGRGNYATDYERMEAVAILVSEGYSDRLVLGCDVQCKTMLETYGGMGYAHIMKRIAPDLRENFGVPQDDLNQILIKNPARLLDRP